MASTNPFDLLGDNDHEDLSQLVAVQLQQQKAAPKKAPAATQAASQKQQPLPAKLPSKPLPPTQAVREAKNDAGAGRGGGRGGGRGYGRGRGAGFNRDSGSAENTFNGLGDDSEVGKSSERGRGSYGGPRGRGGRRGGFSNGEAGDGDRPPRRQYERRSGTGRGNEIKREGSGRGNWGTPADEVFAPEAEDVVNATEKNLSQEQQPGEEDSGVANKEGAVTEPEEKELEEKEMTLDEYEKILEEKRKALQVLKTQERKVDLDKELKSMQQLSSKKSNEDVFIKLGSEKDKRKDIADKEEKNKKPLSINEFLKPAEGEKYYSPSGRGRGRGGRGSRGGFSGGNLVSNNAVAPSIEDPGSLEE